jgi:DNA polymerase III subunit gamma/tau
MLRIRFVCVAAATLSIASVATAGGASAQSTSTDTSSTPSLLTQIFSQTTAAPAPANTAPAPVSAVAPVQATRSGRVASRRHRTAAHTKQAANQHGDSSADTPQSNASADGWLAASAPPAPAIVAPNNSTPAAASGSTQQDAASPPSAVVVGGQTVQIAETDQVNEIDLAATHAPPAAPTNTEPVDADLPRGDRAEALGATDTKASQADISQASQSQTSQSQATQVAFVTPAPAAAMQIANGQTMGSSEADAQDSGTANSSTDISGMIGGAAWIAQMLAALGGALTAGILAWVLIGAEPARNYG